MSEINVKVKEKKILKPEILQDIGGPHPASSPLAVIPRANRWILNSDMYTDIHWWMKSLKTDYLNKKIIIEIFDEAKGDVFNWIQSLINNKEVYLKLTHLDSCGVTISFINFSKIKVLEHLTDYDYSKNEILTHKIVLTYEKIERTNHLPKPQSMVS